MIRTRSKGMGLAMAGAMTAGIEAIEATAASLAAGTAEAEGVTVEEATAMCVTALDGVSLQTVRAIGTITSLLPGTSLILMPVDKGSRGRNADGTHERVQPQGQGWSTPPVGMGRTGGGGRIRPHRKGQRRIWER